MSLSICIPALNEEKTLRGSVADLREALGGSVGRLEIIIVDDGSTDATGRIADEIAGECPGIKVIHHECKKGLGAAYRHALSLATGDYFTWFPADHENNAAQFLAYLPYLDERTVVTSHHRGQDRRSLKRRIVSRTYSGLLNMLFGLDLAYYNGLAVFPIKVLRSSPPVADGFIFSAEALIRAVRAGCRVKELFVPLGKRSTGESKALTLASLSQALKDLVRIVSQKGGRRR